MRTTPFAALDSLFGITDEQAMWRVQTQDDHAAFAQLVRRWEKPIQSLCARMTGDSHRAQDLTQDVFARLFAHRSGYQPKAKFSTWVWRIALNRCYDELRRVRRRGECSLDQAPGEDEFPVTETSVAPEAPPDSATVTNEQAELVRQAILSLTESYRSVVVLRHYEDLKFREIAAVLGIPEGTVKSRMAEAMVQLTQLLKPAMAEPAKRATWSARQPTPNESLIL